MENLIFTYRIFSESLVLGGQQGAYFFNLFYLLAFLVATIWMLLEGNQRKIPWVSWLLVLAFSRLFFIVGTKVISYSYSDWVTAFYQFELSQTTEKVIIEGLYWV